MGNDGFDHGEYKAAQRREWGNAAPGWLKWWDRVEEGAGKVSERLVELAGIKEGDRVLDVATGIGEPALTAARRVGPGGRIVAADISPEMIDFARGRAAGEGLANVEFFEKDLEELRLEESFDAALCRWGLMFLPEPAAGLANIYAALKGGGRFAAAVWSTPDKVPMASLPVNVICRELALDPPPPGGPGIFSLADRGRLKELMESAGFREVVTAPEPVTFVYSSQHEFVEMTKDLAAPIRNLVAKETEQRQAEVWEKVAEAY